MNQRTRIKQRTSFHLFLCTSCGHIEHDEYQSRSCSKCNSDHYRKRFMEAPSLDAAITLYIEEMERERNELTRLLNLINQRTK